MKTQKFYLLFFLFILLTFTAKAQNQYEDLSRAAWYQQAAQHLASYSHMFKQIDKTHFVTLNPGNKIGFKISPTGYTVKNVKQVKGADNWQADFIVKKIGGISPAALSDNDRSIAVTNNKLEYRYPKFGIEYLNGPEGLRQNFVVHQKLPEAKPLTVELRVKTDLLAVLEGDNRLKLLDAGVVDNNAKLIYDDLRVWDANNTELAAHFKYNEKNKTLTISVDDENAQYPVTIDPLNHLPDWSDSGEGLIFSALDDISMPSLYGFSVSDAGDVNGDGIGDIIIGAPAFTEVIDVSTESFNPVAVGAAFLYYGSSSGPSPVPDEVLQPTGTAGALFGFSVSSAGDINNDGYADIIIGAPGDVIDLTVLSVTTEVASGKAYVYYGGPAGTFDDDVNTEPVASLSLSLDQEDFGTLASVPPNALYGYSVSEAGDINADGFDDIVVGVPAYADPVSLEAFGKAELYLGSTSGLSPASGHSITGGSLSGLFGFSVSSAGNVNNDPYDDIIISSPGSIASASVGRVYIFHGNSDGITAGSISGANTTLEAPGLLASTLYGYAVSTAGDVNGDNYDDVIIGEPLSVETFSLELVATGEAHIYYGSNSGITSSESTSLTSPRNPSILGIVEGNLLYGFSVSDAGDVNCDGLDDVIVGEPGGAALGAGSGVLGLTGSAVSSGRSYVYYGNLAKPANEAGWTLQYADESTEAANLLGLSISGSGDVNGDGINDILIGAPNGTLNLGSNLTNLTGNTVDIIAVNNTGNSYSYYGCQAALSPAAPLPVTLLDFSAESQSDGIYLEWITEEEYEVDVYIIEKSSDGIIFNQEMQVVSVNSTTKMLYSSADKNPFYGISYYRLKIVDRDGSYRYSKIVSVNLGANVKSDIVVFPNPVSQNTVWISGLPAGTYQYSVHDLTGRIRIQENIRLANEGETVTLPLKPGLTPGVYLLRFSNTGTRGNSTLRLVVR